MVIFSSPFLSEVHDRAFRRRHEKSPNDESHSSLGLTVCGFKSRKNCKKLFRREYLLNDKSYRKANDIFGKLLYSGFQNYTQRCCGTNHSEDSRTNVEVGEAKKATHKSIQSSGVDGFYSKILYRAVGCLPSNISPIVRAWPRQRQAN